eukprot:3594641-Amphidinium_carterae.1
MDTPDQARGLPVLYLVSACQQWMVGSTTHLLVPLQAITAIEALNRKYEIRPGYGTLTVRHATDKPPNRSRPY